MQSKLIRIWSSLKPVVNAGRWAAFCFLLAACNFRQDKISGQTEISERGLAAFSSTLYPYVRQNCAECHRENRDPRFAQDDVRAAYALAKHYVNFTEVPDSVFVTRVRNGHCGNRCLTNGEAMISALQSWWLNGEKPVDKTPSDKPRIFSKSLRLPELPAPPKFQSFTWEIPGDRSLHFSLEIQRFSENSLRVRKPRLGGASEPLHVRDIRVHLNDVFDPGANAYSAVNKTISAGSEPVLSSSNMILLTSAPTLDVTISFAELAPTGELACEGRETFERLVAPLLRDRCQRCHGEFTASSQYPMGEDMLGFCRETLLRVNRADPALSALITYPLREANDHPSRALSPNEVAPIVEWINATNAVH